MNRRTVLRAVLAAFDRSAASPVTRPNDSLTHWLLVDLFVPGEGDVFARWSERRQRMMLIAYVQSAPAADLRDIAARTRGHLLWLECFERRSAFEGADDTDGNYEDSLWPFPLEVYS